MFYSIYQITNKVNGKIYIGSHKTQDLNDNYMGSGVLLNKAYQKYGVENFKKEILYVFDNPEEMYEKEKELVNEDFAKSNDTYNIKEGGFGGWDYVNSTQKNLYGKNGQKGFGGENLETGRKNLIEKIKTDDSFRKEYRAKISNGLKEYYVNNSGHFKGKQHKQETKQKIGNHSSIHQKGTGNSQYGKVWISDLETRSSFKIDKEQLNTYLNRGFVKGRNAWNKIDKKKIKQANKQLKREKQTRTNKELAQEWYEQLLESNAPSIRKFVENSSYDKSHVSFIKMLKTYIPEFETEKGKPYRNSH